MHSKSKNVIYQVSYCGASREKITCIYIVHNVSQLMCNSRVYREHASPPISFDHNIIHPTKRYCTVYIRIWHVCVNMCIHTHT